MKNYFYAILLLYLNIFAINEKILFDSDEKQITLSPHSEINPSLSSDNQYLIFASDKENSFDIYMKNFKNEVTIKITDLPSEEYSPFFINDDEFCFISNKKDVNGSLFKGDIDDISYSKDYPSVAGQLNSPVMADKKIWTIVNNKLYRYNLFNNLTLIANPDKILAFSMPFSAKKIAYISQKNDLGFNNLFIAKVRNDSVIDKIKITSGKQIIKSVSFSPNGKYIICSSIKDDTNKDGIVNWRDNSVLYLFENSKEKQITTPNYSSNSPCISNSGKIYFSSNKKGNFDIWQTNIFGRLPNTTNIDSLLNIADYFIKKYNYKKSKYSEISKISNDYLYRALLSLRRILENNESITSQNKANFIKTYMKTAEIYTILKKYKKAKLTYKNMLSICTSKNANPIDIRAKILGDIELKNILIKLNNTNKNKKDLISELLTLSKKYIKSNAVLEQIYFEIGKIKFNLNQYKNSIKYFNLVLDKTVIDSNKFYKFQSLYYLSKNKFSQKKYKIAKKYLISAINNCTKSSYKEKMIKEYFEIYIKKQQNSVDIATIEKDILTTSPTFPIELKSFGNLLIANALSNKNIDEKIDRYDLVKKIYIDHSKNKTLKIFSAKADDLLTLFYLQNNMVEEAKGLLLFSIKSYSDIVYGYYVDKAKNKLSEMIITYAKKDYKAGNYSQAMKQYLQVFGFYKDNIIAARGIANCYQKTNSFIEGKKYFEKKYNKDPLNPISNYALGYILSLEATSNNNYDKEILKESNKYLSRAIQIDKKCLYAYLSLSFNYETLYHILLKEKEDIVKRNIVEKGITYVFSPLITVTEKIFGIEKKIDYVEKSINLLQNGLIYADINLDKEIYCKLRLNLANIFYTSGEFGRKDALLNYKILLKCDYQFKSLKQEAIIYERIGRCYFTGNDISAQKFYDKSIKIYKKLGDRESEIRVYLRLALLYLDEKDKDGDLIGGDYATSIYKKILVKLKSEGKNKEAALLKRNIAYSFLIDLEPNKSAQTIDKVLPYYKNSDYKQKSSKDYIIFSFFGLDLPIWKLNLQIGNSSSDGLSEQEEKELLFSMQANNYFEIKDFKNVQIYLNKKLDIFEKTENTPGISLLSNHLGLLHYFTGEYQKSNEYFLKSAKICKKLRFFQSYLTNMNNSLKCQFILFKTKNNVQSLDSIIYKNIDISKVIKENEDLFNTYDIAVYKNLIGLTYFNLYKIYYYKQRNNLTNKYKSLQYLVKAEKYFEDAKEIIVNLPIKRKSDYRLLASILYNTSFLKYEISPNDNYKSILKEGLQYAKKSTSSIIMWKFLYRLGNLENIAAIKLKYFLEAEQILSESFDIPVADYELYVGNKNDIRPLYSAIIELFLKNKQFKAALNMSQKYKQKILLDIYSAKNLNLKYQTHIAYIKKIRYNTSEIYKNKNHIEKLKQKDNIKYKNKISKLKKENISLKSEINDIYKELKKKKDLSFLKFVKPSPINLKEIQKKLSPGTSAITYFAFKNSIAIFALDNKSLLVKTVSGTLDSLKFYFDATKTSLKQNQSDSKFKPNNIDKLYSKLLSPIENFLTNKDNIYIIPDKNIDDISFNLLAFNSKLKSLQFSKLVNLNDLITLKQNINNDKLKYIKFNKNSDNSIDGYLKQLFYSGGILFLKNSIYNKANNPLSYYLPLEKNKQIKISDFLKYKMSNYILYTSGFEFQSDNSYSVVSDAFSYGGIPTIIYPLFHSTDSTWINLYSDFVEFSAPKLQQMPLSQIKSDFIVKQKLSKAKTLFIIGLKSYGLFTLSEEKQLEFANHNLQDYTLKGNRYFKIKRYKEALYFYTSSLQMAFRLKNNQYIKNLLKMIGKSYSKSKNYINAVLYEKKLIDFYRKNNGKSKILGVKNLISKDFLRDKQYDSSAVYQLDILNMVKGKSIKYELNSLNLLSIIYANKQDFAKAIRYRKEYLYSRHLIFRFNPALKDSASYKINADLDTKNVKILFSGLKNLMLNYYNSNQVDSALAIYETINTNRNIFNSINKKEYGKLYQAVGLSYFKKSFYKKAESYYKKALPLLAENKRELLHLNQNMADLYYQSDKLDSALKKIENVKKLGKYGNGNDSLMLFNTQSLIFAKMQNYKKAKIKSYEALDKSLEIKNEYEEAMARVNLAKILLETNDSLKAEIYLNTALNKAKITKNGTAHIAALFYLGKYYFKINDFISANNYFHLALKKATTNSNRIFESKALYNLSKLNYQLLNTDSLIFYADKAIDISKKYDFKEIYYSSILLKGKVYLSQNRDNSVQSLFEKLIDEMQNDILFYRENSFNKAEKAVFKEASRILIELYYRNNLYNKSFTYTQIRDEILLKNNLKTKTPLFAYNEMKIDSLNLMQDKIRNNKSLYRSKILNKKPKEAKIINNNIKNEIKTYDNLSKTTKNYKFFFRKMSPLSIPNIQKSLTDNDILIIYNTGNENIYSTAISKNSIISHKIAKISKVKKLISKFYTKLFAKLEVKNIAADLYKILLNEELAKFILNKNNIIFYADDFMRGFPFETLKKDKYLIDDFNVASTDLIFEITNKKVEKYGEITSFVNAFSASAKNLVFAEREFNSLKWNFPIAKAFIGDKAEESEFYNLDKKVDLIHFPTHSFINNNIESYIQLTADLFNDGKLTYSEIISENYRNKDIIISGCNSGKNIDDYSFSNISNAFMISNANSVISSRWSVDDLYGAVLMKRYFRYLSNGDSKILSLTKAKRIIKNKLKKPPYYWSGFKLNGNIK